MQFIQVMLWSPFCCLHKHIDVHGNCDLRHLQRRDLHCVLQVQEIISKQFSGIAAIDIRTGPSPAAPRFHPISIGAGRSGMGQVACIQIMH